MSNFDELAGHVDAGTSAQIDDLSKIVAIPSVGSDPKHAADLQRSAEFVRDLFADLGFSARVARSEIAPGAPGAPAVIAKSPVVEGRPTVLLYAHHDVQPVNPDRWSSSPFVAEIRGDRIYGRGTSDDGAGIAVHIGAVRALQRVSPELPVNIVVFIEGEEEVGSPSFKNFLADHRDELEADLIIVADSNNWTVDVPAVTASLRGVVTIDVKVAVLEHAVHSGMFGGPILDAVTLSARLISTLHDPSGNVAVAGLGGSPRAEVVWEEDDFRRDASVLPGYELAGSADLAARVWTMPAISVIGMDVTSVADSANAIIPEATFRLSVRTVPGTDSSEVASLVERHLVENAPFGCHVSTSVEETGPSFLANLDKAAVQDLRWALSEAWGTDAVAIGVGGSIPFIAEFEEMFPRAEVLVTGVEDPASNAHSEDESQSLKILRNATLAEALLLQRAGARAF